MPRNISGNFLGHAQVNRLTQTTASPPYTPFALTYTQRNHAERSRQSPFAALWSFVLQRCDGGM
jgi:hypothetical protein